MDVVWRSLDADEPSLEHLRLRPWTEAQGTVVGVAEGRPYTLSYGLEITGDGQPSRLRCALADGRHLDLSRSGEGEWRAAEGQPLPHLRGCTDVDIRATPLTNTLPIRRLDLSIGGTGDLRAAWVDVPSLEVRVARQRYTRTGDTTYRYQDLDSGYSNEITVDRSGLVTLSPAPLNA
ncbi:putative glycolipid-binding domain-containing protein [Deinococcus apachensis]|uniref:putative glycolipid-binding domain-containing protein n=1 Tax=Deinococcus apachensis TaxID=309886 RepID=UPI000376056C|nr:putative glycolipid-binding domain-containing protein [Deinococcus apachensis]